jgi:hypothetical protein
LGGVFWSEMNRQKSNNALCVANSGEEEVMAEWDWFDKEEKEKLRRGEPVKWGRKVYSVCGACKQVVRVNKPLIGSMHPCVDRADVQ